MLLSESLTREIIGAAMEVHRELGPGLLESAYERCLMFELEKRGLEARRQVALPVTYKGIKLDCGYKMDVVVEEAVVLELKAVDAVDPIHVAQLMTYLRLSRLRVGLLINFNVAVMKDGITRRVL